ncbi:hypothetical protein BKA66DRAFT_546187 [Pyrenochaeta sp. MPI-SDFR-AT-0127]|nr:hypothetical protein BKA66DRAFT_546187 [Pyrenochaeta sp. MPI-SDFR-AT-0127]
MPNIPPLTINHDGSAGAIYNIGNISTTQTVQPDQVLPRDANPDAIASTSLHIEVEKFTKNKATYLPRHDEKFTEIIQCPSTSSPKIILMHGEKGTGKTWACRDFAQRACDSSRFANTWWVGANSMPVLETDLRVAIFGLVNLSQPGISWREVVRHVLGQLEDPWLLILDDTCVDALMQLCELLPVFGRGLVIVNTTIRPTEPLGFVFDSLPCRNMTPQQAVKLLKNIAEDCNSDDDVYEKIARRVDCLPFALHIAGTCIRNMKRVNKTFDSYLYLKILEREPHEFMTYRETRSQSKTSVDDVISETIRQVQDAFDSRCGDKTWSVRDALQLLSFFLSENIPLNILPFNNHTKSTSHFSREEQADWVKQHVEAICGTYPCAGWSVLHWNALIGHLHDYHLLDIHEFESVTTYSMHSLLLEWAHDTFRRQPDHFQTWKTTATTILASARIFHGRSPPERTVLLSNLHPHLESCEKSTIGTLKTSVYGFSTDSHNEPSIAFSQRARAIQDILFERIEIFKARGRSRDVIEQCRWLLAVRLQQSDKRSTLESRTQLGNCLESLGEHKEALAERVSVLDLIDQARLSDDRLYAVLDVAKSLSELGKHEEAHQMLQGALLTTRQSSKTAHDDRLMLVQKRLGNVCQRTGRFDEAIRIRKDLLKSLENELYPSDRAEILDAKTNLAHSYLSGSVLQQISALALHREVEASESQNLPDDHPRVLLARENLAWSLILSDTPSNLKEARGLLDQALSLRKKYFGNQSGWTIKARIRLAACDIRMNKNSRCEQACNELETCLRHPMLQIGGDDETRLWARQELADVYLRRTDPPLSPHLCYTGLAILIFNYETYLSKFGSDNLKLIIPTKLVASALERIGCWQAALPFRAQVVRCVRNSREVFDWERLRAENRLASNLGNSPHLELQGEAKQLFEDVFARAKFQGLSEKPIKTDLAFYTMPYIYFLQSRGLFNDASNVIQGLLNDPKLIACFQQEELEALKFLQQDCDEKNSVGKDLAFALYEAAQRRDSFETHMRKGCSDSPVHEVLAYVKAIFKWEKRALKTQATAIDSQISIPCPLPWKDDVVDLGEAEPVDKMTSNHAQKLAHSVTVKKPVSLAEQNHEALVTVENAKSFGSETQLSSSTLFNLRKTIGFTSGRHCRWYTIMGPVHWWLSPYSFRYDTCIAVHAMLAVLKFFVFLGPGRPSHPVPTTDREGCLLVLAN